MKQDNIDSHLMDRLEKLERVATRDPQSMARGRAHFLAEAVSLRKQARHSGWNIFQNKEKLAMNIIVSTLVVVGLLFGGGATVSAAQDDLPNQPLYQLKLLSEDIHLWFVPSPVEQIDMLMEQAQTRLQEMQTLAAQGVVPPDNVATHAQERIQRALQIATQLDPADQLSAFQQIQTRLQTQEQQMFQFENSSCTECIPVLQQTHEMLQLQLHEIDGNITTPGNLQNQNQNQNQIQNQNQQQINQTPQATETVIPSYGTCTPVLDGAGLQNSNGSTPQATPIQLQNQTQQNTQSGSGTQNGSGSGGNGSSTGSGGGSSNGTGGQGGKP